MDHPAFAELQAAAAGDPEARSRIAHHIADCPSCRQHVAHLLGVLDVAEEALGPSRAACPPVEDLADLPPGAEVDDPHVGDCPLCRTDLEMIRALEARMSLDDSFSEGMPHRPERLVERDAGYLQSVPGASLKLSMKLGAKKSGPVAGATVTLEVTDHELVITVTGEPEVELVLVLENDSIERVVWLDSPTMSVDLGRWLRAEVGGSEKT